MLREEYTKDVESYQTRLEGIEKELGDTKERKENSKDIESILKKYKKNFLEFYVSIPEYAI